MNSNGEWYDPDFTLLVKHINRLLSIIKESSPSKEIHPDINITNFLNQNYKETLICSHIPPT